MHIPVKPLHNHLTFHLSGFTVLHCLMPYVLKTIVSYTFSGFLVIKDRWVYPVHVIPSWSMVKAYLALF